MALLHRIGIAALHRAWLSSATHGVFKVFHEILEVLTYIVHREQVQAIRRHSTESLLFLLLHRQTRLSISVGLVATSSVVDTLYNVAWRVYQRNFKILWLVYNSLLVNPFHPVLAVHSAAVPNLYLI